MPETYTINLFEFIQPFLHIPKDKAEKTLLHCLRQQTKYDDREISTIATMIDAVQAHSPDIDISLFDNFFYGYNYKPLSTQFDLLRIDDTHILNIELKSALPSKGETKIIEQLRRHYFYLNKIGNHEVYCIAFVRDGNTGTFYQYNADKNNMEEIDISTFIDILKKTNTNAMSQGVEKLFTPEHYLISPLNQLDDFIVGNYFLTDQQRNIKENIMELPTKDFYVKGGPGTGKTLMLYDIAKSYLEEKNTVLVVHCGMLSPQHQELKKRIENEYGNNSRPIIIPVKDVRSCDLKLYDVILVDETQRIYKYERQGNLYTLLRETSNAQKRVLFIDQNQTLSKSEENRNIEKYLEEQHFKQNELGSSVRINEELNKAIERMFIGCIFENNKDKNPEQNFSDTLQISYAPDKTTYKQLREKFEAEGYQYISLSKTGIGSLYAKVRALHDWAHDTHKVIGQEYDKVLVALPSVFKKGNICDPEEGPYQDYLFNKMLYQALTRARQSVKIIVVEDWQLYTNIVEKVVGKQSV